MNLTILFISHDLPVIRQMCDRIAVLRNGRLCEIALTEELFVKPTHNYTKELLTLMPKIESIYSWSMIFKGCPHNVYLEQSDQFNHIIKDFLS